MPKAAKIAGNLVSIPPNMAKAGWDIDTDVLLAFCKEYGIKWNVRIRFSSGIGVIGSHGCRLDPNGNWYHAITLSQVQNQRESTNTILHELCHAIQNERVGDPRELDRQYASYPVKCNWNPLEIEADTFARDNASKWSGILY